MKSDQGTTPLTATNGLARKAPEPSTNKHPNSSPPPEPLDTCLPSIEEIEAELGQIGEDES